MNDLGAMFDKAIGWCAGEVDCEKHGKIMSEGYGGRLVCPKCTQEAMAEQRRKDDEERRKIAEENRLEEIKDSVPNRYRDSKLADFSAEVSGRVKAWLTKCHQASGSLIIAGPVGTGKTHLAAAITKELLTCKMYAAYVSQAGYLREIRETWVKDSRYEESEVMAKYVRPRVLVLDDIGAARGNENDTMRLGELISERYDAERPSVFVSNLTPEQLKATVGDRSYDRMRDGASMLVLNGDSRRKPA